MINRRRTNRWWRVGFVLVLAVLFPPAGFAGAATGVAPSPARPNPAPGLRSGGASGASAGKDRPAISLRGFVVVGNEWFTAKKSFKAITGKSTGLTFGGGGQVLLRNGLFIEAGIEQYRKTGQRAFVYQGQIFRLGIKDTITLTPVVVTVGYRFTRSARVVPYAGVGVGLYSFSEKADFAEAGDDQSTRRVGYHAVGGAEFVVWRWVAAAAEAAFASVPRALGKNGVSLDYGEKNLGGVTVRVKIVIGR